MAASDLFAKKMEEINTKELQYTEEYFKQTFKKDGESQDAAQVIRAVASSLPQASMSPAYNKDDVDTTWLDESEHSYDGELAVDVFQTEQEIIITSTVAGVTSEDLDIDMNGDMITIRGIRRTAFEHIPEDQFLVRECYWGGFSRTIILPTDINHGAVKATLENGILTIILPKSTQSKTGKIEVREL